MLVAIDSLKLEFFILISSEINRLGMVIQSSIMDNVNLKGVLSKTNVDLANESIWLRVEVTSGNAQQQSSLFENDIINVNTEGDMVCATCSVYSNYGIDNILNYKARLDEFNVNIFNEIQAFLLSSITEHINSKSWL